LIDVNCFFTRLPYPTFSLEELSRITVDYGIGGFVLSSLDSRFSPDPVRANMELLSLVEEERRVRLWAALTVNPRLQSLEELEELASKPGVVAIRAYPTDHGYPDSRECFEKLLGVAESLGLPVLATFRCRWGERVFSLKQLSSALEVHEDVRVVVTGLNYTETTEIVKRLKELRNVLVEISFYHQFRGIQLLSRTLGVERVIFGTAYPLQNPEIPLLKLALSGLSEEEREAIAEKNAMELLRLPP